MSYTYPYTPESASRRPNVVSLPPELFARRSTIDRAVHWIDQSIQAEPVRSEQTIATVTDLATRRVVAPVIHEATAPVDQPQDASQEQRIQDAQAQIEQLHLSSVPEPLDPAYLSNVEQAA